MVKKLKFTAEPPFSKPNCLAAGLRREVLVCIISSRHVLEERERWQDKRSFCDSHPLLAAHAHTAKNNHISYSI